MIKMTLGLSWSDAEQGATTANAAASAMTDDFMAGQFLSVRIVNLCLPDASSSRRPSGSLTAAVVFQGTVTFQTMAWPLRSHKGYDWPVGRREGAVAKHVPLARQRRIGFKVALA
jgi:hypothetical protein